LSGTAGDFLVTPSFDTSHPGSSAGLFRPADHVLAVPQGSAMAILDLERGVVYATTSVGAESWSMLVAGTRPAHRRVAERQSGPDDDADAHVWAQVAGYLLDCRIIDPVMR
jgi:hypothetical protein